MQSNESVVLCQKNYQSQEKAYPSWKPSNANKLKAKNKDTHVGGGGIGLTVKLTSKVFEMPLAPLTVTVAVYVPVARLALGRTVNVLGAPFTAMLLNDNDDGDTVNALAPVPERAIVNAPVAMLPVLFTVIVCAAGRALLL